jgi:hypothetical protein
MARTTVGAVPVLFGLLLATGCATAVPQAWTPPVDMLAQRQLQTRQYDFVDEEQVLGACMALLQDMGFQIDEGASRLGVVLGSKMRDMNSLTPGERAGVALAALGLLAGGYTAPLALLLVDKMGAQPVRIDVGVFTRIAGEGGRRVAVRIVFRETAFKDGRPALPHIVKDETLYREAFDRLSKALVLEARES